MHPARPSDARPLDPRHLTRRGFLRAGALGGLAAAVGGVEIGEAAPDAEASSEFEFEEATIAELQAAMASGRTTSRDLCAAYLARIEALDRSGPALRAVIETNPEALSIAAGLDAERNAGTVRGPLHGIPILIKDNIASADRMMTTAGSLALENVKPPRDAFIVTRLRAAGAVLLGKTNLSEWANFRSTQSSSGWSARGGQCRNPYALDRSPCGSSSGTGAAVAANLAAAGVGTETDGSIVCPSAMTSLVGIKPTLGRVSRSGIVPIAHSQDTAGPMARTVADAALLLQALCGADPRDAATAAGSGKPPVAPPAFDPNALRGARLGIARAKLFGYSPEADKLVQEAIEVLRRLGAEIVDPADIPHLGAYDDAELTVLLYEFKADLDAYLAAWAPGAPVRSLADLIAFNERHRDREMPYFGQELFVQAQEKGPLTDKAYLDALDTCRRLALDEGLAAVYASERLDAIVAPTGSPPWPIDLVNGDHFLGGSSSPAAVSGCPSLTVPVGYSFGLPVGMTFVGPMWSEARLIGYAAAYEHAAKPRRPPRYLPTVDVSVP